MCSISGSGFSTTAYIEPEPLLSESDGMLNGLLEIDRSLAERFFVDWDIISDDVCHDVTGLQFNYLFESGEVLIVRYEFDSRQKRYYRMTGIDSGSKMAGARMASVPCRNGTAHALYYRTTN